jgi:hypothetical protein
MLMCLATIFASFIGGLLWTFLSPAATFFFAAGCSLLSLLCFIYIPANGSIDPKP